MAYLHTRYPGASDPVAAGSTRFPPLCYPSGAMEDRSETVTALRWIAILLTVIATLLVIQATR